jgi:hypothetical protein
MGGINCNQTRKGGAMQELMGGTLMTVQEFTEACLSSAFIDDDGYGVYAWESGNSIVKAERKIFPSDVFFGSIDHSYQIGRAHV